MLGQKAMMTVYLTVLFTSYQLQGTDVHCDLEADMPSITELLQAREDTLSAIAIDVAMFLDVPYFPADSTAYLENTIGSLLRVIAAEQKWQDNKGSGKKGLACLAELVSELEEIRRDVSDFRQDLTFNTEALSNNPQLFISAIKLFLYEAESKQSKALEGLVNKLELSQGRSKVLFGAKKARHVCVGLGFSSTKYVTIAKSPLFFTYSWEQKGFSPKFGIALGASVASMNMAFDNYVEHYGQSATVFHPEHPFGLKKLKKRTTFNWEGSFAFLEGSINNDERYGLSGLSLLPLGFSIGPEFINEAQADTIKIKHDAWAFYNLLGINRVLAF